MSVAEVVTYGVLLAVFSVWAGWQHSAHRRRVNACKRLGHQWTSDDNVRLYCSRCGRII